jgi:hypothetical protein
MNKRKKKSTAAAENEETEEDLPEQAQDIFRNAISAKRAREVPVGEDLGEEKTAKLKRAREGSGAEKEGDNEGK